VQKHQASYNAIASGSTTPLVEPLRTAVQRLVDLRCPSSVYPYVMQLLTHASNTNDVETQRLDNERAADCLAVIESFLVRRALCGIE
ncbi:hypothetical protein, partial [Vibrio cholerae]|uniref:hypothetical protein n=1 Tax=Vibrio cholerae TaxID=666 RepID=UPI0015A2AACC